jgi:hypothetical protein
MSALGLADKSASGCQLALQAQSASGFALAAGKLEEPIHSTNICLPFVDHCEW